MGDPEPRRILEAGGRRPENETSIYPFSYLDPEGSPQRAGLDPRSQEAPQPAAIAKALDPARMRQQHPPRRDRAARRRRPRCQSEMPTRACSTTLPRFAIVASSSPRRTRSAAELEPMHDPTGDPDEDDDSDPHADRDPGARPGLRRQEHERRMIAGHGGDRHDGRDGERRRARPGRARPAAAAREATRRPPPSRATTGLPRRSSTKPASRASTAAAAAPPFLITISRLAPGVRRTRTGETEIATAAAPVAAAITGRSP